MHHRSPVSGIYLILILLISLSTICIPVPAQPGDGAFGTRQADSDSNSLHDNTNQTGDRRIVIHFFFNPGCVACDKIHPFIDAYQANHSEVNVIYYNLANNMTNIDKFLQFQQDYNVTHTRIPILFLDNTTLMGESAIKENLDKTVKNIKGKNQSDSWFIY